MTDAYLDKENRIEEALVAIQNAHYPSIRSAALAFNVPERQLQRRVKTGRSMSDRSANGTRLTTTQERALCEYVDWLDSIEYQARPKSIATGANFLLRQADKNAPAVGEHWVTRWLQRHPEYRIRRQKPMAVARKEAFNLHLIKKHFSDFYKIKQELGVHDDDIYNMDETGFRIGCGKSHSVITRSARKNLYLSDAEDRDYITSIECISAGGYMLPPLLIIKA